MILSRYFLLKDVVEFDMVFHSKVWEGGGGGDRFFAGGGVELPYNILDMISGWKGVGESYF